jgi:opacity protein-like surface antigen
MLLVLLIAAPAGAAAQRDRTVVGGQVGYARSWISTTSDSLNSLSEDRQGASVGLFLRTRVFKWISLQPEIDLTIKGGTFPVAGAPAGSSSTFEFGYLQIPLLVRFAPSLNGRGRGVRPVVFAGAGAGFELGCNVTTTNAVDSLALTGCDETFRGVEWSWLVGGGIQWNLQGVSLGLEARYMKAFTSFIDSPLDPKNNLFAILLVLTI